MATRSFGKSIALNSGFSPAYQDLAWCLIREGRYDEGLPVADALIKLVPRCATAYGLRGYIYSELKRHLQALADDEIAAELGPNNPDTYWSIGNKCRDLGEDANAVDAYKKAIRLLPSKSVEDWIVRTQCYQGMAYAYKEMGKYAEAIRCYEKLKSLGMGGYDEDIAKCRAAMK